MTTKRDKNPTRTLECTACDIDNVKLEKFDNTLEMSIAESGRLAQVNLDSRDIGLLVTWLPLNFKETP